MPAGVGCDVEECGGSVSGSMGWPVVCQLFVSGKVHSRGFRRLLAVREVVETLAPSDGRHFAEWIQNGDGRWLDDRRVHQLDEWGDPIKAWRTVLRTRRAFSPTTLRYVAHAMWLRKSGYVSEGCDVVEIGVGFGGLAAANAVISGARTVFVDLPPVCDAARVMMGEIGLSDWCGSESALQEDYCLISNYAFSELRADVQEMYFEKYIRAAPRGAIFSNAAVFAERIGGRTDDELVDWFRSEGVPAMADGNLDILSPADRACGVKLIHWNRNNPS